MTARCTDHCSACGTHFHSTAAFDAHREGLYRTDDPARGRRCVHPLDKTAKDGKPVFVELTDVGSCHMYEEVQAPVKVWTLAASVERARNAWPKTAEARKNTMAKSPGAF